MNVKEITKQNEKSSKTNLLLTAATVEFESHHNRRRRCRSTPYGRLPPVHSSSLLAVFSFPFASSVAIASTPFVTVAVNHQQRPSSSPAKERPAVVFFFPTIATPCCGHNHGGHHRRKSPPEWPWSWRNPPLSHSLRLCLPSSSPFHSPFQLRAVVTSGDPREASLPLTAFFTVDPSPPPSPSPLSSLSVALRLSPSPFSYFLSLLAATSSEKTPEIARSSSPSVRASLFVSFFISSLYLHANSSPLSQKFRSLSPQSQKRR